MSNIKVALLELAMLRKDSQNRWNMKQVTVVPGNKAVPFSHLDFPHASLLSNIKLMQHRNKRINPASPKKPQKKQKH